MKRVVGALLLLFGISLLLLSNKNVLFNKEESKTEIIEEKKEKNETKYQDVENYLKDKYNETFEVIEVTKEYCLEKKEEKVVFSRHCDSKKIKNTIYKAKEINSNIEFYVKKVSYDETKVEITESIKDFETSGYYDNYISFIVAEKKLQEISQNLKDKIGEFTDIEVYEGLGIHDISLSNAYQYLDNKLKDIVDKEISTESFIEKVNDNIISISINKNESLTKENIQEEIKKINELSTISIDKLIIKDIIIEYKENRYIKYNNDLKTIEVKVRKNKDSNDSANDYLYNKVICMNDEYSKECIKYNEFTSLSKEEITF